MLLLGEVATLTMVIHILMYGDLLIAKQLLILMNLPINILLPPIVLKLFKAVKLLVSIFFLLLKAPLHIVILD